MDDAGGAITQLRAPPIPWDACMLALKQVTIYTDGACMQNPGPGGYGVVLLHDGHTDAVLRQYFRRDGTGNGSADNSNEVVSMLRHSGAIKSLSLPL